jgi:hypothetical protein
MEDPRCQRVAIEIEDPRCQSLLMMWRLRLQKGSPASSAPDSNQRTQRGVGEYIPKMVSSIPSRSRCGGQQCGLTPDSSALVQEPSRRMAQI